MRARLPLFVAIVQSILIVMHLFLYETWIFFWGTMEPSSRLALQVSVAVLSISFVAASLLAFRYFNIVIRIFYTLSAFWLGLGNFFLLAACMCWVVYIPPLLFGAHVEKVALAVVLFGLALLTGIYGVVNASWTRVKRISVKLPNLPESGRGRTAAVVSDLHLGHIRNVGFAIRIAGMLAALRPDVVFIPGDLYDGTAVNLDQLTGPWSVLSPPLGTFFVTGNHEQFSSPAQYLGAVKKSGMQVLNNERIVVHGLQIVGVHYRDSVNPEKFRSILKQADVDRNVASILLVHTPDRLAIAAEEGISLQLSGHTHRGQFFPFTMIVSRIYGEFAYGLKQLGSLMVYVSCGAGTWGPPFRVGTNPEIVLIRFE